jgi:predicted MFS family arabinose efflux permease
MPPGIHHSPPTAHHSPLTTHQSGAWVNVGVAALLMVSTFPGRTYSLGLLTEPLKADFHLDDVTFGQINLWATLFGSLFCLPCGWLIDRLGTRPVLGGVLTGLGVSVVMLSAAGSVVVLAAMILLTRGFGQSALSVVSLGIVGKTKFRRRELAMAIFSVLMGVGFAAAVWAVKGAETNSAHGWRDIWRSIGLILLVGVLPVSWVFHREPVAPPASQPGHAVSDSDFTFGEALRSPAFWAVGLTCSFFLFVSSGAALFYEGVLKSFGFGRPEYEEMLGMLFLFGTGFNLLCGWLAQRWSLTRLLGVGSLVLAGSLAALPLARTMTQLYWYAAAVACSGGVVTVVFFIVWRQMYGAAHVGQIQGAAQLLTVVASALSLWLFPAAKEWFGSYVPLLQILAAAAALLAVWVWFVPAPRRYTAS